MRPRPRAARAVRFALGMALVLAAQAEAMTIRELRTLENTEAEGKTYANYYLVGVLEGLREASDQQKRNDAKPLFCIDGRRLEPAMARSLYQGELARNGDQYEADMPVQLVLDAALRGSFKCRE